MRTGAEMRQITAEAGRKPIASAVRISPVSVVGVFYALSDIESWASPPKPLSESGAVLARPRIPTSDRETPTWGCPSVTGPDRLWRSNPTTLLVGEVIRGRGA